MENASKHTLNPLTFLVWHDYLFKVNFLTQAQLTFASVASFELIFDPFGRDENFTKIEDHETENLVKLLFASVPFI